MAKVILSVDGVTLKEFPLVRERTSIGRKAQNDIRIDNLAVSGEHAAIITMMNDSFLEDLDSTNGTYVNGRQVKKHFLQDGDVIELAKYRITYMKEAPQHAGVDAEKTMVLRQESVRSALEQPAPAEPVERPQSPVASITPRGQLPIAAIQVLNGQNAGREMDLAKTLTTLGKPGVMVAAIARRPLGYFITHVEGPHPPRVSGRKLEANKPYALMDHDIIELGGVKMEFFLRA
ncbi:MAG: FHA domain-containing protein [Gammaproteobacteria bacterium]|nr:FHA domain-containing protein [Gammaproteobacteria bacterium]MBU1415801.1 FHA domain-containing protein [Gammaproteobacteria bacterium]